MDHIVVLRKLSHALPHFLAISMPTKTHQGVEPSLRLLVRLLFGLRRQIISEEIVLFNCEWVNSVMFHEIIKTSKDCGLIFNSCEACYTFFISDCVCNLIAQILQSMILADIFILFGIFDDIFSLRKQAKLLYAQIRD